MLVSNFTLYISFAICYVLDIWFYCSRKNMEYVSKLFCTSRIQLNTQHVLMNTCMRQCVRKIIIIYYRKNNENKIVIYKIQVMFKKN